MSNEEEDQELEQMRQQLEDAEKAEREKAATATAEPEPEPATEPAGEPVGEPQAPQAQAQMPEIKNEPVTPNASPSNEGDNPMEWAKRKGLNSPEAIARSLQQMEQEFHKRNQNGHPGYQDIQNGNPSPQPVPPQNWQPRPEVPAYGYQQPAYAPPPPSRDEVTRQLATKYGMDPDDVTRLMPMVVDMAEAVASRRSQAVEREINQIRLQSERSTELMRLAQDPAYLDPRVQKEMHEILKDGSLFQRGGQVYTTAFNIALANLARQQLQQGANQGTSPRPPVTAGGGNGSANSAPYRITEKVFNSWTDEQQDAYIKSNGRVVPKR